MRTSLYIKFAKDERGVIKSSSKTNACLFLKTTWARFNRLKNSCDQGKIGLIFVYNKLQNAPSAYT